MNRSDSESMNASSTFLSGGGELGALMRAHDWSTSPLGAPDTWPQSLRAVVSLLLNSKFPMFIAWGPALGFLYNDPYAEILGAKHPSALGCRFRDVWSEIWNDIVPLVDRALAGEATYKESLPLTMRRKGYDEPTWFTFSYSPVRDESGAVAGMYCACVETTAQILAERSRIDENERLRSLFAQAPGFMAVLRGPDHIFELTNKSYLQLVGHRDLTGKSVREAMPEVEGQGFVELLDRVYTTGEPFVGHALPIKLQREPGGQPQERFVDFVYQPITDRSGNVVGIFAEGSDVTERSRAQEELQAANRRKDEFLAMLAHELRNPLAPISTAAELLRLGRLDDASVRQTSDIISRQVEHMTDLVDDLLDVSRVTRGLVVLNKEPTDINVLVSDAVEQVRGLMESRRHRLMVQTSGQPASVLGDRTRLVQVIVNVLNNAARYTPTGGDIALRVNVAENQVEINVRDNGIGISPEVVPYIFELFTQAERSPDRSQGGLGLGLALVRNLARLHDGSVEAQSEGVGKGSQFVIRLPRLSEPAYKSKREEHSSVPKGRSKALRVMVVDDNADAAETLAMLLEADGHEASVEYDARSALERARLEAPHALLLDIGLPDMDGYELARRLRSMPETGKAVLIALTGYGQSQDHDRSKSAGFDHHLVKPADTGKILALLAEIASVPSLPIDKTS
jgi:PAS domain S-box-containing protein